MSKDRAAPFSRKHRRYWLPVTGGMILIGALNLSIGYCSYDPPPPPPSKIELVIPPSPFAVVDAAGPGAGSSSGDAALSAPAAAVTPVSPPAPESSPPATPAPPAGTPAPPAGTPAPPAGSATAR